MIARSRARQPDLQRGTGARADAAWSIGCGARVGRDRRPADQLPTMTRRAADPIRDVEDCVSAGHRVAVQSGREGASMLREDRS
ncbi:hypothetical protein Q0Z83_111230 [Actinoplanes sichuanensis]|nr:hypothetical protein Q0Z83_111230 [Actinoplanes sichuanensis]